MTKPISMFDLKSVLSATKKHDAIYRAKTVDSNTWVYGFYLEGALTSGSKLVDCALQIPNHYPVEVQKDTLCKYVEDLRCFEKDWLTAKTDVMPVSFLEGFVSYNVLEYCIEQIDDSFPLCSFAVIDHLSIVNTGKNIIDNPELLQEPS